MERRESEVSVDLSFCFQVSYSSYPLLSLHLFNHSEHFKNRQSKFLVQHFVRYTHTHTQALEIRFSIRGLFIPRGPLQLLQIDRHHHHHRQSQFNRRQHRHYHHWWQLTMPNTGWCPSLLSFNFQFSIFSNPKLSGWCPSLLFSSRSLLLQLRHPSRGEHAVFFIFFIPFSLYHLFKMTSNKLFWPIHL